MLQVGPKKGYLVLFLG